MINKIVLIKALLRKGGRKREERQRDREGERERERFPRIHLLV